MKMKFIFSIMLVALCSCDYRGSWTVGEPLKLKTVNGNVTVPSGNWGGSVKLSSRKAVLSFSGDEKIVAEIKIPKDALTGGENEFKILGSKAGQEYDILGEKKYETVTKPEQCEKYCYTSGEAKPCVPKQFYTCNVTQDIVYITLSFDNPYTQKTIATFNGEAAGSKPRPFDNFNRDDEDEL